MVTKDLLKKQQEIVQLKLEEIQKKQELQNASLERIAGLSVDEAREKLTEALKQEVKLKAFNIQQELIEEAKLNANKEAKKIVIQTIQRIGSRTNN